MSRKEAEKGSRGAPVLGLAGEAPKDEGKEERAQVHVISCDSDKNVFHGKSCFHKDGTRKKSSLGETNIILHGRGHGV